MEAPSLLHRHGDRFVRTLSLLAVAAQGQSRKLLHAVQDRRWRFAHQLTRPARHRRLRFIPIGGASAPGLKIETGTHDGAYVIRLSGEVDLETITLLQDALDEPAHHSRNVILDCQHLTYMDSTGFKLLADLHKRGRRLALAALTPTILKISRILALDTIIPIAPSVEEALKGLVAPSKLTLEE
jgi:anti-anti-sigma factor